MADTDSTEPAAKKMRRGGVSKKDEYLHSIMINFKTVDPEYPTCWHVYKMAAAKDGERKRKERDIKAAEAPIEDQVKKGLSKAIQHNSFANRLDGTEGKEKQAAGMRNAAQRSLTAAQELYNTMDPDAREQMFGEAERACLENGTLPVTEEDMAALKQENAQKIMKLAQERDELHQRVAKFEREIKQSRKVTKFMRKELTAIMTATQDVAIKKRIEAILSAVDKSITVTQ